MVGAAIPPVVPAADHPSNSVVELIVTPEPAHGRRPPPGEVYAPWDGFLNVRIRNVSLGPARVDEADWTREYTIKVLDSSGRSVPMTERGKSIADALSRPRDPRGYYGPAGSANLTPGEENYVQMNLKQIYQVEPGRAYTIKLKRSAGLPKLDEYGKPLQQRELSCTVVIDERGVPR
jgi:hypothetical protein